MNGRLHFTVMLIAGFLFMLLTITVLADTPPAFDVGMLTFFAGHASPAATTVIRSMTWLGSITILAPVSVVIGYWLYRRGRRADANFLLVSLMLASVSVHLLKYLIGRERPDAFPALVDTFAGLSFPSGHAAQVTAFCLALLLVLRGGGPGLRALAGLLLFGLALSVSVSRLYLQVHFPTDVIGGVLLAVICVSGCALLATDSRA